MYGEYLATRALALAISGDQAAALEDAEEAQLVTHAVESRAYAAAAHAVVAVGTPTEIGAAHRLLVTARELGEWDAVVCAVRASMPLAMVISKVESEASNIARVLTVSGDHAAARAMGLSKGVPYSRGAPVLTPRELEILDLLRQGLRNKEIAATLFISPSTVKVHVQHIREKLGARTRAEAVARYAEIAAEDRS
jgi:DNA-binding CsgD family transcriptional regulator